MGKWKSPGDRARDLGSRRRDQEADRKRAAGMLPAIPPSDYRGGVGHWMRELQERGLWDGRGFHGDRWITEEEYNKLLEATEGPEDVA